MPLVGEAFELLKTKQSNATSHYVFAEMRVGRRSRDAFAKALVVAKIEDFRFHDLRHTAASYLAMSGATLSELSEILGHKTLAMVKRYSHFTQEHNVKLAKKMAKSIGL